MNTESEQQVTPGMTVDQIQKLLIEHGGRCYARGLRDGKPSKVKLQHLWGALAHRNISELEKLEIFFNQISG